MNVSVGLTFVETVYLVSFELYLTHSFCIAVHVLARPFPEVWLVDNVLSMRNVKCSNASVFYVTAPCLFIFLSAVLSEPNDCFLYVLYVRSSINRAAL